MRHGRFGIMLVIVLIGMLAGGYIGEVLSGFDFFKWMSLGGENGYVKLFSINPMLDIHAVKLGIDLTLRINAGSIIGMVLALLLYH